MNRVLVLLFVAFMLSGPVHAQPPNRSTAIAGVVNDATGAAIVGAPSKFDDDLNTPSRVLPKYAVVNLSVSRDLGRDLEVFGAVQNMFDEEYFVGSLPTLVGPPRMVSAGLASGSRAAERECLRPTAACLTDASLCRRLSAEGQRGQRSLCDDGCRAKWLTY